MADKDALELAEPAKAKEKKPAETRSEAIERYMRDGYTLPSGLHRRVSSEKHAVFLHNAGTIKLP